MAYEVWFAKDHSQNSDPSATLGRAPINRLARARVAATRGGFDPKRIGGATAWLGTGAQRPVRHVACNIIVGPYCVSFQTRGL